MLATYSAFGTDVSVTWGYLELHVGNLQGFLDGSFFRGYLGLYAVNLGLLGTACWQPTGLFGRKFL